MRSASLGSSGPKRFQFAQVADGRALRPRPGETLRPRRASGFRRIGVAAADSEGRRRLEGLLAAVATDVHVAWEDTVMELLDLVEHRRGCDDGMASRIVVNHRELAGVPV